MCFCMISGDNEGFYIPGQNYSNMTDAEFEDEEAGAEEYEGPETGKLVIEAADGHSPSISTIGMMLAAFAFLR